MIPNPKDSTLAAKRNNGTIRVKVNWNNPGDRFTENIHNAQVFVDSETLRLCSPYMPIRSGTMIRSGILATNIGSGEVMWRTPYVRMQYYQTGESRVYDAQRGAMWFERMKIDHKEQIEKGAKRIGGK